MKAIEVLKKNFGYENFKADQESIIHHILEKKHALVLMPTGMGKSLCYQVPAKIQKGLTVVVSPLIALMKDQVDQLKEKDFKCCEINSSLSKSEREKRYKKLSLQEYELIYVAPERFRNLEFLEALKKNNVSLLAVDEAHCISEWGQDFRPDYTRLKDLREILKNPTTVALTATATEDVQKDIVEQLGLKDVTTFNSGLKRDNLALFVHDIYGLDQKIQKIVMLLNYWQGPAILYFSLISTLEKASHELQRINISHGVYHGQLSRGQRKKEQDAFLKGESNLILATSAFGLGINKSDIRLIIHAEVPDSLESYYQEIGRAGRDGKTSQCHLLYDDDDVSIQTNFIKWAHPEPEFILSVYNLLESNISRVNQEGARYLREKLNFYNSSDFRVETALNLLERWGFIEGDIEDKTLKTIVKPSGHLVDQTLYQKRLKSSQTKLLKMVQYAKEERCRLRTIYAYFGLESKNCTHCDFCLMNDDYGSDLY